MLSHVLSLPTEEREEFLSNLKNTNLPQHIEVMELLPFTEGDCEEPTDDPFIGEVVGHYTIKKRIGSGGTNHTGKMMQRSTRSHQEKNVVV
ncbi:MAG: hypothetical protein HOC27_01175, partial [Phycisphaerae bacterium]|nr:hypothetical protein [Phycisphaerae bacterium]